MSSYDILFAEVLLEMKGIEQRDKEILHQKWGDHSAKNVAQFKLYELCIHFKNLFPNYPPNRQYELAKKVCENLKKYRGEFSPKYDSTDEPLLCDILDLVPSDCFRVKIAFKHELPAPQTIQQRLRGNWGGFRPSILLNKDDEDLVSALTVYFSEQREFLDFTRCDGC